ncbi:hypothetical protein THRCLA_21015 [Thraustotheca clavata]|uniref:SGNH domain-containing protein n=1 Tax=Thraustotheca clavata TaxID=74557 RepID=A0A1W0A111_9STRA|nr:hypothetical protein THRCLA_21015 [Thraustotheca clavata]
MNPEGSQFHYKNMLQGTEIIATKPVLLSDYRQKHERLITMIENATHNANATLINFSDNRCFENVCEVISTAKGEPIMKDSDHFRSYYITNYLTVLDQIIAATKH